MMTKEQVIAMLSALLEGHGDQLDEYHDGWTSAIQEAIKRTKALPDEPSDGPHPAFLEMPEGYSGPVKISNPGAPVANVTVEKGAVKPKASPDYRALLQEAYDNSDEYTLGTDLHARIRAALNRGESQS